MTNTFTRLLPNGTTTTTVSTTTSPPITAPEARQLVADELALREAARLATLDAFDTRATAATPTSESAVNSEVTALLKTVYRGIRTAASRGSSSITVNIPLNNISQIRAVLENKGFTVSVLTGNFVSVTINNVGSRLIDNIRISWS